MARTRKKVGIKGKLKEPSLGDKIVNDMEQLVISEGPLADENFTVLPWQRDVVEAVASYRRIAFSIARANGKTTLVAALACSALRTGGALFRPRGEIILAASSFKQASIAFRHLLFFMRPYLYGEDGKLLPEWRVADNHHVQSVSNRLTGVRLDTIGSDARRSHGLAPSLIICDEPAKWVGGGEDLYIALKTGMGKQVDSKLLAIGTQSDDQKHWFQRLLRTSGSKFTWARTYAADKDDPDFDLKSIEKANPSYHHMTSVQAEIEAAQEDALSGGTNLFSYRAMHLNTGTPETATREMIISVENWTAVVTDSPAPRQGPLAIGIDLGGGISMSAVAFYWPATGRLETYGAFPAEPGLNERGVQDGVGDLYIRMQNRGEITIYPGFETNNVQFLNDILTPVREFEWLGIVADLYAKTKIAQVILELGYQQDIVDHRRVGRGPGGKEDVEAFQAEVLSGHMSVGYSLALESAILEAQLIRDSNGNPALDKRRFGGRIDMMQAAVLAVGAGYRWRFPPEGAGIGGFYADMLASDDNIIGGV